jgi:hypothetical protein
MRDQFKTTEYFNKCIEQRDYAIKSWMSSMEEKEIYKERLMRTYMVFKMESMIAKYSAGYEIGELEVNVKEIINLYYEFFCKYKDKNSTYYEILQMISLSYLFELNEEFFNKIKFSFGNSRKNEKNDWLLNFLLNPINENYKMGMRKLYLKSYQKYYDLVNANNSDMIKILFDKIAYSPFYKGHYYSNSHKEPDEKFIYFGYWNFGLAALGKILKIDDSNLKDCKYYPYDLAHYKE